MGICKLFLQYRKLLETIVRSLCIIEICRPVILYHTHGLHSDWKSLCGYMYASYLLIIHTLYIPVVLIIVQYICPMCT